MCGPRSSYWLPAIAFLLFLPATSYSLFAQTVAPAGNQSAISAASANLLPNPTAAAHGPKLSNEDIGDIYEVRQRYQAAIDAYAKVEQPSAVVWNKMGIAYQMLYDFKDAERCYNESLRIYADNASVLNNLGTAHESMREFGVAERFYRKALKLDPRSPRILKNLGTNLLMQHEYEKGEEAYRQALLLDAHIFDGDRFGPQINDPAPREERGTANYFKARSCAAAGMNDCAIDYLRKAFNEGAATPKKIAEDSGFASLRGTPELQKLLALEQ